MVKNKLCVIVNLTENEDLLKPLTHMRPVAALPFAGRYRLLDFYLSSISHAEIDSCALFISESGRSVYDHIRSGAAWNFDSNISGGIFTFSQQNWKIRHIEEHGNTDFYDNHRLYIERSMAEYVFVSGSKMVANVDVKAIHRHHLHSEADITLVQKPIVLAEACSASCDYHLLVDHDEQFKGLAPLKDSAQGDSVKVNLNMYVLSVDTVLDIISKAEAEGIYMELDALIQRYIMDYKINIFEYTGYAANIETISRYFNANMEMLDRAQYNALFYNSQPVLTTSKNGVPSYYSSGSKVTASIIATGARVYGEVDHAILSRKVRVSKGAQVKHAILFQGVTIEEGAQVEYAIIDKRSVIESGAKVIGSPDNIIVIPKNTRVKAED